MNTLSVTAAAFLVLVVALLLAASTFASQFGGHVGTLIP